MQDYIKFSIPLTLNALTRMVAMLTGMADDLKPVEIVTGALDLSAGDSDTVETTEDDAVELTTGGQAQLDKALAEFVADGEDSESPPPPPPVVELDKANRPWDERIDSDTHKKTKKDGLWMLKRGVDKALVAQVLAEITPAADDAEPDSDAPPPPPPPAPDANAEGVPPGFKMAAVPGNATYAELKDLGWTDETLQIHGYMVVDDADNDVMPPISWAQLMPKIAAKTSEGIISKEDVDGMLATYGLEGIQHLPTATDETIVLLNKDLEAACLANTQG